MQKQKIELLAPAGDLDIAKAALRAGADACYIGGKWSARAYARNFGESEVKEILDYAHERGKKVYVALNTMLYEREMQEALSYTRFLYEAGVDAVIAADLGYIQQVRRCFPELSVHVSTQAGIQCGLGAKLMQELGCTRVVAARECTFADLADIAAQGIEVEAFCHGAMCSGISGACLMSGMIGGRSGNRGRCAQPCRQEYTLFGKNAYHLSTRDLCTLDLIGQFAQAGVCSLKIEGRMKKREYVVSAVSAYRKALDAYDEGRATDCKKLREELACVFNRGGFSQGYLSGSRDITYLRKPGHMGLYLGKIQSRQGNKALLATEYPLQKGDSIEIGAMGFALAYADKAPNGWYIPVSGTIQAGDRVYLKSSPSLLKKIQQIAETDEAGRQVTLDFTAEEGGKACLIARSGEWMATAEVPVEQKAQKPVSLQSIREKLCKSGGTNFAVSTCHVQLKGEPFLPATMVNGLRRQVLEQLSQKMMPQVSGRTVQTKTRYQSPSWHGVMPPPYIAAQVCTAEQAQAAADAGATRIYAAPQDAVQLEKICRSKLPETWLVLPPFFSQETAAWAEKFLQADGKHFYGLIAPNPGAAQLARKLEKPWFADYWMNIANQGTVALLENWGAAGYAVSAEIENTAIKALTGAKEYVAYGQLPLMNLRHCPVRKQAGCTACGSGVLQDKMKYCFPMGKLWAGDCLAQVYNAVPIALQEMQVLRQAGIIGLRLLFTGERARQVTQITQAYKAAWKHIGKVDLERLGIQKYSNGHFFRGVE